MPKFTRVNIASDGVEPITSVIRACQCITGRPTRSYQWLWCSWTDRLGSARGLVESEHQLGDTGDYD